MSTQEVAEKLVQLCREGKNIEAINELYADNIKSYEPKGSHVEFVEGRDAALAKTQEWFEMVEEVHSSSVGDPIVTGNFFAVTMDMDITYKGQGRSAMNEIAVYQVADGKIVGETFFYNI
jgi:hypothetical protein